MHRAVGRTTDWLSLGIWRRATGKGAKQASEAEPDLFKGQWLSLATAGIDLAVAVSTAPANPAAIAKSTLQLVSLIVAAEDAQADLLKSLDANMRLILDGPFHTAMLHLETAVRSDDPHEASTELEQARLQLYQAHSNAFEPADRALVQFHIGLVWLALGRRENAKRFLGMAYETLTPLIRDYAEVAGVAGSKFEKFSRKDWIATVALAPWLVGPLWGLGRLAYIKRRNRGRRRDEQARSAVQRLLALGGTAASVHNELAPIPERLDPNLGLGAR